VNQVGQAGTIFFVATHPIPGRFSMKFYLKKRIPFKEKSGDTQATVGNLNSYL